MRFQRIEPQALETRTMSTCTDGLQRRASLRWNVRCVIVFALIAFVCVAQRPTLSQEKKTDESKKEKAKKVKTEKIRLELKEAVVDAWKSRSKKHWEVLVQRELAYAVEKTEPLGTPDNIIVGVTTFKELEKRLTDVTRNPNAAGERVPITGRVGGKYFVMFNDDLVVSRFYYQHDLTKELKKSWSDAGISLSNREREGTALNAMRELLEARGARRWKLESDTEKFHAYTCYFEGHTWICRFAKVDTPWCDKGLYIVELHEPK